MGARTPRILMVQPKQDAIGMIGDHPFFRWTGYYRTFPPLGLLTVAAHLPRSWQIELVDNEHHPLTDAQIDRADYVFLSGLLVHKAAFVEVAERAAARGKHVVAGGPFVSDSYHQLKGKLGIRTFCLNECESYMEQLVQDIESGQVREVYGETPEFPSLEDARVPRFDLLPDLKKYMTGCIEMSRGCPFRCDFCNVPQRLGRTMRYKSPASIIAELEAVGAGPIFIADDNLAGDLRQARVVLRAIADWQKSKGYPIVFYAQLSLNTADHDDVLELLYEANVRSVYCGVESPSKETLRELGKHQNLHGDVYQRIDRFTRAGIEVIAYLIVGFDSDAEDIAQQHIDFISRSKVSYAELAVPLAIDGTRMCDRLKEEGRLLCSTTFDTERVIELANLALPNYTPKIPPRKIQRDWATIVREQFAPRAWYKRARELVERLPARDREHHSIDLGTSIESLSVAAMTLAFAPGRLRLMWEGAKLFRRTKEPWRVYRFYYNVFGTSIITAHYEARADLVEADLAREQADGHGAPAARAVAAA